MLNDKSPTAVNRIPAEKNQTQCLQHAMRICLLIFATVFAIQPVYSAEAASLLADLTNKNTPFSGLSVEDNIAKMDTDKNGFADVFEVRAFLASIHGKDYQKALLDRWEASASSKSCGISFAKDLVTHTND